MTEKELSRETRRDLLALARDSIEAFFRGEPEPRLSTDRAELFGLQRALFVTLRRGGELRGCIGTLAANGDVARIVPRFARRAAFEDPRFLPLEPTELPGCEIEISILSPPEPVTDPEEIAIGRDGLILEARGRSGLLLPQVATEWGFDREAFLGEVSRKAGLPPEAWKDPETKIWRFQAEVFAESESKVDGGGT
ncbi:MAG TPA: AmmeMemoRadiSam system protein A [Thermoanaerobaculia bacterium]|nr:AmmeMemoRadiSam system protein A [Thermoanaerobaculia bacterium]